MKLGKVIFDIKYVVDLDNQEMVDQAVACLFEDMLNAYKYDEIGNWINAVEDDSLSELDIPDFLLEDNRDTTILLARKEEVEDE